MSKIHIQFTRFSAFYSPLILTIAGGFLKEVGLDSEHSVAPPGKSAISALINGSADVAQSALSQAFAPLEKGEIPPVVHFAQINEMDGFFIAGREPDPNFTWNKLTEKSVLVDHGAQPLAMFKFACHRQKVDYGSILAVDAGDVEDIDKAFREGKGTYVHQQGPAPQQLEYDGVGHVIASVGKAVGTCGFSSLAATRDWLNSDMAVAFMQAYRKARLYINSVNSEKIAEMVDQFFPTTQRSVLSKTISFYQNLGCWTPHVEITEYAYQKTLDVFEHNDMITKRHSYSDVVTNPLNGAKNSVH